MGGKDRATDKIFIEKMWRSVKCEYLFLKRLDSCYCRAISEVNFQILNYSVDIGFFLPAFA